MTHIDAHTWGAYTCDLFVNAFLFSARRFVGVIAGVSSSSPAINPSPRHLLVRLMLGTRGGGGVVRCEVVWYLSYTTTDCCKTRSRVCLHSRRRQQQRRPPNQLVVWFSIPSRHRHRRRCCCCCHRGCEQVLDAPVGLASANGQYDGVGGDDAALGRSAPIKHLLM